MYHIALSTLPFCEVVNDFMCVTLYKITLHCVSPCSEWIRVVTWLVKSTQSSSRSGRHGIESIGAGSSASPSSYSSLLQPGLLSHSPNSLFRSVKRFVRVTRCSVRQSFIHLTSSANYRPLAINNWGEFVSYFTYTCTSPSYFNFIQRDRFSEDVLKFSFVESTE